jgi:hypothetical protein
MERFWQARIVAYCMMVCNLAYNYLIYLIWFEGNDDAD